MYKYGIYLAIAYIYINIGTSSVCEAQGLLTDTYTPAVAEESLSGTQVAGHNIDVMVVNIVLFQ